jgi:putative restriction endonuclease
VRVSPERLKTPGTHPDPVPDPISSVPESKYRKSLEQIREWEGEIVLASRLQADIPGFKAFKGIYKPAGSSHALWIRQTKRGVYPDKDPEFQPDGSWSYLYSPESQEGRVDESLSTYKGLIQCMKDGVPVGVFRQTEDIAGRTAYRVLGLGSVEGVVGNHFVIKGEPINETAKPIPEGATVPFTPFDFSPGPVEEVIRKLRERRFTSIIREIYHERCSLCEVGYRMHVIPVKEKGIVNDVRNGLLLCSNHHALFDGFAWTFDREFRVLVTEDGDFRESALANHLLEWEGKRLPNLPSSQVNYPAAEAIDWRLVQFRGRD